MSVLVVDDNIDAATTLAMLLEAAGHRVAVEHAPLAAIERARALRPDVCLLDIGLPGMDGIELARRLRAQRESAGALLVAVSGYGQEADRHAAPGAGFAHHRSSRSISTRLPRCSPPTAASASGALGDQRICV
ncbi:response regulator [Massilia sp. Se16.2.3]|uniref:response regulator n=1 Tax=Massilia sp. Se16.2.3 TaxID=2709303 RepID=UPI0015FFEF71|nr:response regulator [Massilia sp. Se16.2.3]QNA99391.1 response regulator [Massilia sp. Se16.2.3]